MQPRHQAEGDEISGAGQDISALGMLQPLRGVWVGNPPTKGKAHQGTPPVCLQDGHRKAATTLQLYNLWEKLFLAECWLSRPPGDINQDVSVPVADGSQATAQGAGPDPGAVWPGVTSGMGRESSWTSPGPLGARPFHGASYGDQLL